jgi:DNA-directed RNA polymerase specialized sigma subunit
VAKFVFLESLHEAKRDPISLEALSAQGRTEALTAAGKSESEVTQIEQDEKRHECLQQCLRALEQRDRDLICQYYYGEQRAKIENRHRLAARLGLSANALMIRACRIRRDLEACVRRCMGPLERRNPALKAVE